MNVTTARPANSFAAALSLVAAQMAQPVHRVEFEVVGEPKGEPRARLGKTAGGHARAFKSEEHHQVRFDVRAAFLAAVGRDWTPWEGPVKLEVIDLHAAPATGTWPGEHCRKKPDWDNSGKLVGDALNGVAWKDDAVIVLGVVGKARALDGRPRKVVRLTFCHPVPKPPKPRRGKAKPEPATLEGPFVAMVSNGVVELSVARTSPGEPHVLAGEATPIPACSEWPDRELWRAVWYPTGADEQRTNGRVLECNDHPSRLWASAPDAARAIEDAFADLATRKETR